MLQTTLDKECFILGIDIDDTLVKRAQEKSNLHTQFCTLDFMNDESREKILREYLLSNRVECFDFVFCFSITMWIHLNHGDSGLEKFLYNVCEYGKIIVLEPQTWDSYKTAVRRLKLAGEEFVHFKTIKLRNNVEIIIENLLVKNNATKIHETTKSKFKRKIYVFKIDK